MSNPLLRRKPIAEIKDDALHDKSGKHSLKRILSARDLTLMGIAAIIGAGSFSSLGSAVFAGGPGVVLLFIICGIACGFTAYCYAEFAARIPVAGSAYTYAYASFGELAAWVIGWALLLEYSIGNIYVAFSWSDYFTSFLERLNVHLPAYLTCSYTEASKAVADGTTSTELLQAWNTAPLLGSLKIIADVPALVINILITILVYRGVKESRNFTNAMAILKMAVILLVIIVGAFYIDPANWQPANDLGTHTFMPNGFGGVMMAVSGVFFAYVGFDAVSVMAEEAKNPQRDLPKGMIWSLAICTVVYIILALVLTGVMNYRQFENVGDPLAEIFKFSGVGWMQLVVSVCAVVAMTSVMLVFQMGQPRIWLSMSRDGLLPPRFSKIHPRFKTPSFATIVTGLLVGVPILFTDKTFVLDFTSIGTLFAFLLVCGGVLLLPRRAKERGKFYLPNINSRIIFPAIIVAAVTFIVLVFPDYFLELSNADFTDYTKTDGTGDYFFKTPANKISTILFWLSALALAVGATCRRLSLIPLLGLTSCLYLLTGMTGTNWMWFSLWFSLGLVVYFFYGFRKSALRTKK